MRISVVIPMFNASGTILKCIQALAAQEVLPDEVIVVDNNSTDNSRAIVQDAAGRFRDINITVCEEPKRGPAAARNKGGNAAAGDIIAFIDTDCIPDKCWVKSVKEVFVQNKSLDFVGGIDKALVPPVTAMGKLLSAFWLTSGRFAQSFVNKKEDFFDNKCVVTFNCAIKKEFFKKINGFDESFQTGEDIDITLRGVDAGGKIIAWNNNMVVCHHHDISFKSMLRREFYYAEGLLLNIDRHFRNSIFVSLGRKHYHWPNKNGITVVLMSNAPKIFILMLVLLAAAWISPKILTFICLAVFLYFCVIIRKFVRNSGSSLTLQETVMVFFIYLGRVMSKFYGRLYWSFKYKIICL